MSINTENFHPLKGPVFRAAGSSAFETYEGMPLVASSISIATPIDVPAEKEILSPQKIADKLAYVLDRWKYHYQENSRTIASLAVANVLLTIINEFAGRSIYTGLNWANSQEAFILWDATGNWMIHRQSLVNIFMTFFLSFAGGPIHFLRQVRHRFMYFSIMAVLVSLLSQCGVWLVVASTVVISVKRALFDLCYSATIKYPVFELVRPWVLKHRKSFVLLFGLRYSQDLILSMIRIGLLILLGLNH